MRKILSFFTIFAIMALTVSPVFAGEITVGDQTFTTYTQSEIQGNGESMSDYTQIQGTNKFISNDDVSDYTNAVNAVNQSSSKLNMNASEFTDKAQSDLNKLSGIMNKVSPDYEAGAKVISPFNHIIRTVLGFGYILILLLFVISEGYNFYLVVKDEPLDESTMGGSAQGNNTMQRF